ncbi:MAG TPA: hypothetical protein VGB77_02475 [Abditibacteriaceae bacterium]|jgi:uncharacterized protein (DUF697 family)
MPNTPNENIILTHAVLCGLTPLIPVPFVDDIARTYFRRQLVQKLAAAHGQALPTVDIQTLADEESKGCLRGCLGTALVYPIKFLFRKIFFFLEGKRAIDTASTTYYFGFLTDYTLQKGWCAPEKHSPAQVRAAIDAVIAETDPSFINRAMKSAFAQSKNQLKAAVTQFTSSFRGGGSNTPAQVASTLEATQQQEKDDVQNVVNQAQQALNTVPESHFDALRRRLAQLLNEDA